MKLSREPPPSAPFSVCARDAPDRLRDERVSLRARQLTLQPRERRYELGRLERTVPTSGSARAAGSRGVRPTRRSRAATNCTSGQSPSRLLKNRPRAGRTAPVGAGHAFRGGFQGLRTAPFPPSGRLCGCRTGGWAHSSYAATGSSREMRTRLYAAAVSSSQARLRRRPR